jgi:hypothetical protein
MDGNTDVFDAIDVMMLQPRTLMASSAGDGHTVDDVSLIDKHPKTSVKEVQNHVWGCSRLVRLMLTIE